jgi:hypothetical protein
VQWNRQYMVGSSIRSRSAGDAPDKPWSGYRGGDNRDASGLDVLQEFKQPRTVSGGLYDTLVITEQHGLLGTLVWNDTVRHLRHYHDRFIDANPKGRTWFYESWLDISDKSDPRAWIAYERMASQNESTTLSRPRVARIESKRCPQQPRWPGWSIEQRRRRVCVA